MPTDIITSPKYMAVPGNIYNTVSCPATRTADARTPCTMQLSAEAGRT